MPPVMLILKVLPSYPKPFSIVELMCVSPFTTVYGARASISVPARGLIVKYISGRPRQK